jgi:hypothetical protein
MEAQSGLARQGRPHKVASSLEIKEVVLDASKDESTVFRCCTEIHHGRIGYVTILGQRSWRHPQSAASGP